MVKTQSDSCTFNHNWSNTVEGAFNKYPNEFQPNVKSIDILDRRVNSEGELVTEKMLRSKFIPNILMQKSMAALGMPVLLEQANLERSKLNLEKKTYTMNTCNVTYLEYMKVFETLVYSETKCEEDTCKNQKDGSSNTTTLTQTTLCDMYAQNYAWVLQWAVSLGEKAVISEVKSNIPKGRSAMKAIIPNLIKEFENFTAMTEEIVREKSEVAENMIKKCGGDAIESLIKMQEDLNNEIKNIFSGPSSDGEEFELEEARDLAPQTRKRLISEGSLTKITTETEQLIQNVMLEAKTKIMQLLQKLNELISELSQIKDSPTYQKSYTLLDETEAKLIKITADAMEEMEKISNQGMGKVVAYLKLENGKANGSERSDLNQLQLENVEKERLKSLAELKKTREYFEKQFEECRNRAMKI